jgi:GPH family glycoside/pentoside/hexuronide:cation symporter
MSVSDTRPEDRVPLKAKLAYGAAGVVDLWATKLPPQLVTPIFVGGLGMSPALVSLALVIFRFYDAIIDPLMGWISDNTRTRWGRRKPYLLVGTILTGLWFPVMWHMGRGWSEAALFAWLVGSGIVFFTFFTLWAMPFHSMLLEMTPDYNERTSVSSWRSVFGQVATMMIGWAWYLTQLPWFTGSADGTPDPISGAQTVSLMAGALVLCVGALPVFFVTERYYQAASRQKKVSLRDNFRWTFQNRPFVLTAGFTLFFCCASALTGAFGFYLRLYYVVDGDQVLAAKIQGVESTLFSILGFACVPFFNWLSRRIGKTWTLQIAMGLLLVGVVGRWWTYTPDNPWLSIVSGVMLAPAFTGIWQLIPSINGDVVDYDELRTGERREGAFASIFSWIVKASFSLGTGLSGPLVVWCGFEVAKAAAQAPETYLTMRLADLSINGALILAAMYLVYRYPLSPARMAELRAELETRRGKI